MDEIVSEGAGLWTGTDAAEKAYETRREETRRRFVRTHDDRNHRIARETRRTS